jgi:fibronectin-binding autotransporter adhesin
MKKLIMNRTSLAAASLLLAGATLSQAANGVWLGGGGDGNWTTTGNWVGDIAPGIADGTTVNTDSALFTNSPSQTTLTIDLNRNLAGFTFDSPSQVAGLTFGGAGVNLGNPLLLTSGGTSVITATVPAPANGQTTTEKHIFNAPLVLEGDGGNYTFLNNATSLVNGGAYGVTFNLAGNISGVATVGNTTTLNIGGTQAGYDHSHSQAGNAINGVISDGIAGGKLGLTKNGTGSWLLDSTNTYTGPTIINGGNLELNWRNLAIPATTNILAPTTPLSFGSSGGTLVMKILSNLNNTQQVASITLNGGQAVIQVNRTTGGSGYWNLGSSITRNIGANLDIQKGGSGTYFVPSGTVNTLPLDARGAAYLSAENFADWAGYNAATTLNSGSYTKTTSTATVLTNNAVVGSGVTTTTLAANTKINCLLDAVNQATTINLGGFTLTNGGTLVSSTVATAGSSITNGTLIGPSTGADVVILQNSAQPFTVSAVIADNGSASALTKGAAGLLALTAANTYSGVTYINAGSLQLGNGGTSGSINSSSVVTNHGNLVFNRSDATTFGLVINGIGGVTNAGSGTVTFTTNHGYTGNTVINAGTTLQLGNGGASGTISNSAGIINNGTLNVNLSGSFGYPGVISGSGQLVNQGGGKTILSGNNTYSGNTLVTAGTLALGAGGLITNSAAIILSSGATLDVSARTNYALNGAILPNGQILAGTGTVLGSVNANGACVITPATNGVYGTLTVSSNLTLNGGALKFDVSSGSKDRLNVGGTLNLQSGSLTVNLPGGSLVNGSYPLINYTNGLLGDVANITVVYPGGSQVGSLSSATPNWITLIVSSANPNNLVWLGTDGTNSSWWDVSTTMNWTNGSTLSVFSQNDNVRFDDTATTYTVDIRQAVSPGQVVVNSTTDYTLQTSLAGKISGSASLVKSNSSTLTILTTNDYSGSTTIAAGTLQVGSGTVGGRLGSGSITNNAALIYNSPDSQIVGSTVSGNGSLTVQAGTVILSANNAYSGNTTNASGTTLQLGLSGTSGSIGSGNLDDEGGLIINRSDSPTFNNTIVGNGSVTNSGSGTVTLGGANSYAGATFINNGTVKLGSLTALGAGLLTLNGGASVAGALDLNGFDTTLGRLTGATGTVLSQIRNNAGAGISTLTINSPATATFAGLIADNTSGSGKVALVHLGPSALTLSAANTYSGGTLIAGGSLTLSTATSAGTGLISFSNGVVTLAGFTYVNPMNIMAGTTNTINGVSSTSLNSVLTNSGTVNLVCPATGAFSITAAWPNFGGTIVLGTAATGPRLLAGSTGAPNAVWDLGSGYGILYLRDGGTIDMGALTSSSSGTSLDGSSVGGNTVYRIGALNLSTDFPGTINNYIPGSTNISMTCGITKVGTGTLTLDGTLNYSGPTIVSAGVLAIGGPNNSGASLDNCLSITVNSNAVLDVSGRGDTTLYLGNTVAQTLAGYGTVNGNITAPGSYAATINFSGTNNGIFNVTSALLAPAGSVADTLVITNDATLNNATVLNFGFANATTPGGGTNDLIRVGGNLALNGIVSLRPNFLTGTPAIGQPYTLITYGGTLSGDTNNLALDESTLSFSHLTAEFSTATPGVITVVFNLNPSALVWQGYDTNSWQPGVVTNWLNAGINTNFYQYDTVTFDDSASNSTVALVGTLQPSRITVSNSVATYLFTNGGSGVIAGGTSLNKRGSGILSIATANTYTGGTTNSGGGTIDIGGIATALGTGPLVLSKGTFLSSNAASLIIANPIISAAGTTNVILANGAGNTRLSGNISGSSGQLEFASVNTKGLDLSGDNSSYSGAMKMDNTVIMRFLSATAGNLPSVSWDLGNVGAMLGSKVDGTPVQYRLGALSSGGNAALKGHLSSSGGAGANVTWEIGALGMSTTFGGTITDGDQTSGANNTSLIKVGSGTLTLSGTNTYTGNTTISNGVLELSQAMATLATNSTVTIASGAQLKLTVAVTNQVASLITNGVAVGNGLYTSANSAGRIIGSGYLRVGPAPTRPAVEPILASFNGSQLTLTWTQAGWTLQAQTNNLVTGLNPTGWSTVTGAASPYAITVDPSRPTVFYRLTAP